MFEAWVDFFLEAGLLMKHARTYALSFVENRIQPAMLEDLDKKILKEMGVVAFGDIIAILRHAKVVLSRNASTSQSEGEDEVKEELEEGEIEPELGNNTKTITTPYIPSFSSPLVDGYVSGSGPLSSPSPISSPSPSPPKRKVDGVGGGSSHSPTHIPTPTSNPATEDEDGKILLVNNVNRLTCVWDAAKKRRKSESDGFEDFEDFGDCNKGELLKDKEKSKRVGRVRIHPSRRVKEDLSRLTGKERKVKKPKPVTPKRKHDKDHHKKGSRSRSRRSRSRSRNASPPKAKLTKATLRTRTRSRSRSGGKSSAEGKNESKSSTKTKAKISPTKAKASRAHNQNQNLKKPQSQSKSKSPQGSRSRIRTKDSNSASLKKIVPSISIPPCKPNLVMCYREEDFDWIPVGMGNAVFRKGLLKCLPTNTNENGDMEENNDNDNFPLLASEIRCDTVFDVSKETFLSWTDFSGKGHAFRFKEKEGFNSIWEELRDFLGKYPKTFMSSPSIVKYQEEGGPRNGVSYALSAMQGWRCSMEDAHSSHIRLKGRFKNHSFFALFDGHGGAFTANYAADNLLDEILLSATESQSHTQLLDENSLKKAHLSLDQSLKKRQSEGESESDGSGSTAISLMIGEEFLWISNLGDSRAILCSGDGKVIFGSEDHKPLNGEEMRRIYAGGGSVSGGRINGDLAVSRGFGDLRYKEEGRAPSEQIVSAEPTVTRFRRGAYQDDFVVLGSDGVWDVVGNEEVGKFIQGRVQEGHSLKQICNLLLDFCLEKGSRDNMSIIIVKLDPLPKSNGLVS